MPELPEVETSRAGIAPYLEGHRITALRVRQPRLRWPVPSDLAAHLEGQIVRSVSRRGKYLLIAVNGGCALLHLGMSGSVRILPQGTVAGKHDHVDLELDSGLMLRLTDPRRFGALLWQAEGEEHKLLASLGPEPLSDAFDVDHLGRCCKGRRSNIKAVIMDSHVVVGVGNIYANEALYLAGIDPRRAAGRISIARLQTLVAAIKAVLARAIEQGGTTLRDFVGGDGKPGYFSQELNVYGRAGEACPGCGNILKEVRLAQRSTVFCSLCQT
ncbi:Formamidopyrimidine-DNA glycosylase [Marinobacterium lacunae]|uniref:Formamidopyrimidine-DNA glycosylase n=1 Tax=Marinobacterium lacunae TaxID=1232683 RepID=A0A081FYJ1_9GAMM|nr:bifunctional DNA-formamidopyrimidine glycosylase/DNA-(apurinic or apyrimidinic site) lyase [Marinobacterium lacunae]KEA63596.1 Formamidopyrimidine-DNA glycosylase [Marinobacterium lacunae]MBR9884498.1 bifunctional DNA-formamidopyrimidine glycosylase/DNA-(apurinic or apyrimidinic site) lyase [Oceanospirillales bacterium]